MSPESTSESSLRKPPQALEAEAAVLGAMLLDPVFCIHAVIG